jgi:hypothetical protein
MKKNLFLLILFVGILHQVNCQRHINFYAGLSYINPSNWNRTIEVFNFSRPWLTNKIPNIRKGKSLGLGFSGVVGKGIFLSPEFTYLNYEVSCQNDAFLYAVNLKWLCGNLNVDLYPREFKLDSVPHTFRPFVRLGVGGSSILPRVQINNALVFVDDETYKPILWTYQICSGLGCRIALTKRIDLTPLLVFNYSPNVILEDFSYALNGTNVPSIKDKESLKNFNFFMSLSIRLKNDNIFEN